MAHLWPLEWYDLTDGGSATLQNYGTKWQQIGYDNLNENDYARLEPFLEPFDGVYTDKEIAILSRLGNNGVQKELCHMFMQQPSADNNNTTTATEQTGEQPEEVWVLEWYLDEDDIRRIYLKQVSLDIYGKNFENDETECMIMLTHALAALRRLKITIQGDKIIGEIEEQPENIYSGSLEDVAIE